MGLGFSRIKPEDWHPRAPGQRPENVETLADYEMLIETRDILHRKLSRYAARFCLREEMELHIESLFFAHVFKPVGSKNAYWSEEDLSRFYSTVPTSCFPKLPLSCSVLYKLLLRLGSFPYITVPAPYLTYDVFRLGLIMLSGRYTEYNAEVGSSGSDGTQNAKSTISYRYRRMMFQALAETNCEAKSSNSSKNRSDSDDEDLLDALHFLKNTQQWDGPDPLIGFNAAPLPAASSLPSSLSTNLHGKIAWDEIKALLQTLLVLKIQSIDIRVNYTASSGPELCLAVDSIIAAIEDSMPGKAGKDIHWSTFDTLFNNLIPKALAAISKIVDLFFTLPDKTSINRRREPSTVQRDFQYPTSLDQFIPLLKSKDSLLTLPNLSLILSCINFDPGASHQWRLRHASFIFSGSLAGLLTAAPKFENGEGPKEFILLLSGTLGENEEESPPQEVLYAVVCLDDCCDPYETGHYEKAPFGIIVQLAPILRQFSPSRPLSPETPPLLPRMDFSKHIQSPFKIKIKNGLNNWAQVVLEQGISTYARTLWVSEEQERREESFKVETIEMVIFQHQERSPG